MGRRSRDGTQLMSPEQLPPGIALPLAAILIAVYIRQVVVDNRECSNDTRVVYGALHSRTDYEPEDDEGQCYEDERPYPGPERNDGFSFGSHGRSVARTPDRR